jgi:hypothetical protein
MKYIDFKNNAINYNGSHVVRYKKWIEFLDDKINDNDEFYTTIIYYKLPKDYNFIDLENLNKDSRNIRSLHEKKAIKKRCPLELSDILEELNNAKKELQKFNENNGLKFPEIINQTSELIKNIHSGILKIKLANNKG